MEKITVSVAWCDKNFGGSFGNNVPGVVMFTARTFAELQQVAKETLDFYINGMVEDGEGEELRTQIIDLKQLLHAYRHGTIKEKTSRR